jgi:TolB protein
MRSFLFTAWLAVNSIAGFAAQMPLGLFDGQSDIGAVSHPGSVHFDEVKRTYAITASGANLWAAADEFHFVWKRVMPGDVAITASVDIVTAAGNNHRKGVLMMRQSLDPDSAYVSAALHGDGLASLQSRPEKGGNTYEVQSNLSHPKTLRLVKHGNFVYLWTGSSRSDLKFSGGSMFIKWTEPFYIGIGACAHEKEALVDVEFDRVHIDTTPAAAAKTERHSTIETVPYPSGDRRAIYATEGRLRGPVFARDGASLIVSHDGRIERVPIASGKPVEPIGIGGALPPCESFQGVSPDGRQLAITCGVKPSVYVVALDGTRPDWKRITHKIPTIWHAWSPDGQSLLYSIERKGRRDFDRIPSAGGGKEMRLTNNGASDNPEFSHDGKFIYFNSDRGAGGTMQIWRMPSAGSNTPVQITKDDFNNWYPHLSPDGKRILMLSCDKAVSGPPEDREVLLRVYTLESNRFQVVARILTGGKGTIDSPSWSPDGRRIAFVTYQFPPEIGQNAYGNGK